MAHVASEMEKQGFDIPLLVGGATTSKIHTALKIEPNYSNGVIHGGDASKTVEILKGIMNDKKGYLEEIKRDYEKVRENYMALSIKNVSIEEAREKALKFDWNNEVIDKPEFMGIKEISYSVKELREYIDWTFFFIAWEMKKTYPEILQDEKYGEEARKLFKEANDMLDELEQNGRVNPKGVFGIFKCNSIGDDIELYNNDGEVLETFNFLRQQKKKKEEQYISLTDFIAPKETKIEDYIGSFLVTAGAGVEAYEKELKDNGDDYKALMLKLLCDRLAEASAEKLHEDIRKTYWGYAKDEDISKKELFQGKYRGIRPAFGYPSLKDPKQIEKVFKLLNGTEVTSVTLTESYMMNPVSSVCGLYFGSRNSKYFDLHKLSTDQIEDYSKRTGEEVEVVEKRLNNYIL
jgi:5-methyltetrahydrofolate--homocysteine methyltransferase